MFRNKCFEGEGNQSDFLKELMQRLLYQVVTEIKTFVQILFDAIVIFYKLDIKYAETANLCLVNLLTSFVLKNPIYTKIENLIVITHLDALNNLEDKMGELREKYSDKEHLASLLDLNIAQYGLMMIKQKKPDEAPREVECEKAFEKEMKKMKHIRSTHSPVTKMIFLH